jgi:hypothetical protein
MLVVPRYGIYGCHRFGAKNFHLVSKFSDVYTPGIILVYGKYLTIGVTWGGGEGAGKCSPIFFLPKIFWERGTEFKRGK